MTENQPQQGFSMDHSSDQSGQQAPPPPPPPPKQSKPRLETLPNSGGILAMGIISIVSFCCCWGFVGIVLGIIALVLASKANQLYMEEPERYSETSVKNMRAGKTCAIIGLALSSVVIIIAIVALASDAWFFTEEAERVIEEIYETWDFQSY